MDIEQTMRYLEESKADISKLKQKNYFLEAEIKELKKDKYKLQSDEYQKIHNEMLSIAMKALEKQIPKKEGKPRLGLVPPSTIESVGKVMTYGLTKYQEDSWKEVEPYRYIDALMRHLVDYLKDNNSIDEESGLLHIEHILCNAAFLNDMRGGK